MPCPKKLQKELNVAQKHVKKRLGSIATARSQPSKRRFTYLIKTYLQSYEARLIATAKARGQLKWYHRPRWSDVPEIADKLNAWAGTREPAKVILMPKGNNGGYRLVIDFRIENRALQYLILPLIESICSVHPLQFGGKGVSNAIDKVGELMVAGYTHTIETDITNCFPSFEEENLRDYLFLPKEVIRHVIMAEHLNVVPGDKLYSLFGPADGDEGAPGILAEYLAEARRGIPQGSALASRIAEVLMAPVLESLPKGARVPTRWGREAIRGFALQNAEVRATLARYVPNTRRNDAAYMAAFYADAAPLALKLNWSGADEQEALGIETDLLRAGVEPEGFAPLLTAFRGNLDHLDNIRAELFRRRRSVGQPDIPAAV